MSNAPAFAVINLDNGAALRNTTGAIATWPTEDAAWTFALRTIANFDVIPFTPHA